jgi:hypothetical protein
MITAEYARKAEIRRIRFYQQVNDAYWEKCRDAEEMREEQETDNNAELSGPVRNRRKWLERT